MKNALELIKEFCIYYFQERNLEKTLALLADNIFWFGASDGEDGQGIEAARNYLAEEIKQMKIPYKVTFKDESWAVTGATSSVAKVSVGLTNLGTEVHLRISACAGMVAGESKLFSIHISVSNTVQRGNEFFPKETINDLKDQLEVSIKAQQKLMDRIMKNLPCGIAIGIVSSDYKINLQYISDRFCELFEDTRDNLFVALQDNLFYLIYQDDQVRVRQEVLELLKKVSDGKVIYRYPTGQQVLWIEMNLHCVLNQDGTITVYATYYDVTDKIRVQDELNCIIETMNGAIVIFEYNDNNLVPIYATEGIINLAQITKETYRQIVATKGTLGIVFKADRDYVLNEVINVVNNHSSSDLTFRIINKRGDLIWLNASISYYGNNNVIAVFTGLGKQAILYRRLLDEAASGVYVCDCKSHELLYTNKRAFQMVGQEQINYSGKKCFQCLLKRQHPCANCLQRKFVRDKLQTFELNIDDAAKTFEVTGRIIDFNGREAFIQYVNDITDKKKAMLQLEESASMLNIAIASNDMNYWVYDLEAESIMLGEHTQKRLNLKEPFLQDLSVIQKKNDILPESFVIDHQEMVSKLKTGVDRVSIEVPFYRHGRKLTSWIKVTYTVISWNKGKPLKAIGIANNITKQKELLLRYQRELQVRDELLKEAVVYYQLNLTKRVLENKKVFFELRDSLKPPHRLTAKMWETALQEIIGCEYWHDFRQLFTIDAMLTTYYAGKSAIKSTYFKMQADVSDKWYKVEVSFIKRPESKDIIALVYVRDVDKEYKQQLALETTVNEEIEYVSLVNVKSGLMTRLKAQEKVENIPPEGTCLYEEYGRQMIKRLRFDLEQKACRAFFTLAGLQAGLAEDKELIQTCQCLQSDGRILHKKLRATYLDESHEDIVITRRDITDLFEVEQRRAKELLDALNEAKRANSAKSDFLSNMSHEIRTPLNAIIGMTKLARDEVIDNQAAFNYIEQIDSSSEYLLGVINDILDMSQIESGKFHLHYTWTLPKTIMTTCIEMIKPLMERKGIKFTYPKIEEISSQVEFYIDELRVEQLLMNLLNNAYKFTPAGGQIKISLTNVYLDKKRSIDRIVIQDTGCGMSQDFLKQAFNAFSQETNCYSNLTKGTGLGLALVQEIIKMLKGTIAVESQLGKGTTFVLTIPYKYRIVADSVENKAVSQVVLLNDKRVLLVEDNELNATIASRLLEKKGMLVVNAINGKKAVDLFNNCAPGTFDVILMDIRMPVMDGLTATKTIRNLDHEDAKTIPIIAMMANAFDKDKEMSKDAGMNDHLSKPINPSLLYETLAKYIIENKHDS